MGCICRGTDFNRSVWGRLAALPFGVSHLKPGRALHFGQMIYKLAYPEIHLAATSLEPLNL
jgi:hypothetical protein